ncbi:MAG: hypothetical protein IJY46_05035 [Lentisphaeria bacterium]|nr:hypothetical protein [Lentisphaeria bacterium]
MEQKTYTGTIVFLSKNEGSKSESFYPFLYQNKNNYIKLFFRDDNPFENNIFDQLDGCVATVSGEINANGELIVSKIEK